MLFERQDCSTIQVIDKNGPPPKGTGIKQLRENIAESKLSYEIMDDAAQVIAENIHLTNYVLLKYDYVSRFS